MPIFLLLSKTGRHPSPIYNYVQVFIQRSCVVRTMLNWVFQAGPPGGLAAASPGEHQLPNQIVAGSY